MKKSLFYSAKYIILSCLITTLAILSVGTFKSVPAGLIIFIFYLLFFGYFIGSFIISQEKKFWQIFLGIIFLSSLISILLSGIYWFYKIDKEMIYLVLAIIPVLVGLQKKSYTDPFAGLETEIDLNSYIYTKSYLGTKLLSGVAIFTDATLFWYLFHKQYSDTLISPWTIISPKFFLLFIFSSILIYWTIQKSKHNASNLLLIIMHFTLILSVTLIIFKLGYGFDPFIHQATERWIAEHGTILPKQPYYLGQYMLVIFSYALTHLKIDLIDRLLVPIGAGIIMPLIAYFSFSRSNYQNKIFPAILSLPILPLIFFNNTSPNNLALLLALVVVFWIWYLRERASFGQHFFGLIVSLASCAIHPFIGLPILIIYLGFIIYLNAPKFTKIFYPFYFVILTLLLPLVFWLNSWRQGQSIKITNPLLGIDNFLTLFSRPFYYWLDNGSLAWKALYYYHDAIKPLVFLAIFGGIYLSLKKYHEKITWFFILSASSLFLTAFLLSTSFKFPGVIDYEQNVYSNRLLEMGLIILLPFFIICLQNLFSNFKKRGWSQLSLAILFSSLLLISFYFTYPTRDPISHYTGYNIRQADIDAVTFIMNRNLGQTDYIVLTNQAVATAALREFSFIKYFPTSQGEQYFYSIPTGGPFYQYFRKMVYEEPKKEWMVEAINFANVKKAYFIHTNYWAPAAEIRDKAKLEADAWWDIGEGRVWVYEYILK